MSSSRELLLSATAKLFPAMGWVQFAARLGCTPQRKPSRWRTVSLELWIFVPFLQGGRGACGEAGVFHRVNPAGTQRGVQGTAPGPGRRHVEELRLLVLLTVTLLLRAAVG